MNPISALLPIIPASNSPSYNKSYDGNIQLMEARYLELCSSLRALDRSMKEIREYIIVTKTNNDDNDNNNNNDDDDDVDCFIDAIKENAILFTKQRHELYNIINGMNNLNFKNVLDIPDDILSMDMVDVNEFVTTTTTNDNDKDKVEDKNKTKEKKNQNYVFTAATIDDTVIVNTRGGEDNSNNNNNNDDNDNNSGVYL